MDDYRANRIPMPSGRLLPGLSAQAWNNLFFAMFGMFLAGLLSLLFFAPAFHPDEAPALMTFEGVFFAATTFPAIVVGAVAGYAGYFKMKKELHRGYTTVRWSGTGTGTTEVRDSHGRVIPEGDRRLKTSATLINAFCVIGSICAAISPFLWVLSVVIRR
ncbi:hypothetical protein [Sinomonas humi]|uniref:Uncharacterized protein n=1 Tax=Sinomonas humi TaxID=1338436 RepID=A0A0B2AKN5_9MICC|nr:hypothetical protein [Sinomonas humi]KHL02428.1 hypothetical protein LK10_12570 [Sinomonas humi]